MHMHMHLYMHMRMHPPASSRYEHVHSEITPFLSASSGRPPPTFHSCHALDLIEMPALLASSTSATHVLSVESCGHHSHAACAHTRQSRKWWRSRATGSDVCMCAYA